MCGVCVCVFLVSLAGAGSEMCSAVQAGKCGPFSYGRGDDKGVEVNIRSDRLHIPRELCFCCSFLRTTLRRPIHQLQGHSRSIRP